MSNETTTYPEALSYAKRVMPLPHVSRSGMTRTQVAENIRCHEERHRLALRVQRDGFPDREAV